MSNLTALRTTLKKLGANAAQFFTPPALRTRGGDSANISGDDTDASPSVWQSGITAEYAPDGETHRWDVSEADSRRTSASVARPVVQSVEGIPLSPPDSVSAPIVRAEPGLYVPELDDAVITLGISPASPVAGARLATSTDPAAVSVAPVPTAEQIAIACAPADECQLVIAGPGTGKTFTVIQRLEYLLGAGGLDAGQILVLSFSRSAVREIRTRLRARIADDGAHGDLDFLQVRTFDSFAYRLLEEVGQTPNLSADSYDQNIRRASRLIAKVESDAHDAVAGLQHLIVDELQDLVGVRALLVENILKAMDGGFTLFGDPAQAIYDYQSRQSSGPSATSFLRWLRTHGEEWQMRERTLTRNMRGSKECFALSERHRPSLLSANTAYEALGPLRADLKRLPDVGLPSKIDSSLKKLPPGTTAAILCRTNHEALQVHMHLLEQKIPHEVAVNIEDIGLPAWVGRVFSTWTGPDIMQAQFVMQWRERIGTRLNIEADAAWEALLRAASKPDGTRRLRMDDLRRALAAHPELPSDRSEHLAPITVSTIHRAKGREYDWVVVLEGEENGASAHYGSLARTMDAEEARVLYVAVTRARQRLKKLRRADLGRRLPLPESGRENVSLPNGDVLMMVGIQDDVDTLAGVSASWFLNVASVTIAQDYLWDMATGAREETVNLIGERTGWNYTIRGADDRPLLGRMSSTFGVDAQMLSMFLTHEIGDLHKVPVRAIETVVLSNPRDDICTPYSQSGMFLTLRLQGAVFAGKRG